MSNENFIEATKKKIRFSTTKGSLSVEDLWDLNLESLDKIAVAVDEDIQKEGRKSFIGKTSRTSSQKTLSLEILKFIIEEKIKEEEKKKDRLQKAAQKEFLSELLNKKRLESLESLSVEEIQKQLSDLD
jgi:hypothetical protein